MRLLGRGSPRVAFVVGLLLSFPGVSYLTGLNHIDKLDAGAGADRAARDRLLPGPADAARGAACRLLPRPGEDRRARSSGFRAWLARNGRAAGIIVAAVLGALVLIRGIAGLVS